MAASVVIKVSSSRQIDALIADLSSAREVTREAAVARLSVIGQRAVSRLGTVAADPRAAAPARVAALRALGAIADLRALPPVYAGLRDADDSVVMAAVAVARTQITGEHGAAIVDNLTRLALDRTRSEPVRAAAVRALRDLEPATIAPLMRTLQTDGNEFIRALAGGGVAPRRGVGGAERALAEAADSTLPADPAVVRRAVADAGSRAPLTTLQRLIDRIREREQKEEASAAAVWQSVRGAVHAALAARGSRIALYDLRESFEGAQDALPDEFVSAARAIGDAACLEALAAASAHTRTAGRADGAWQRQLAGAFAAVMQREGITRRHAVMKRIQKRWPEAAARLAPRAVR
jgi:HEAT repeat protein